jgi:protein SCO1/2
MKETVPLLVLLTCIALMPVNSLATGDNEQYRARDHFNEMEHQHHGHAMAGNGYTRSVASYRTPDVKLVDAGGKKVALASYLDGKEPVMLNFIFTTCTTICPAMSATFSQLQAMLGQEGKVVRMVSISIDPEHDTPGQLNEYAKRFETGTQWHLLTGSVDDSVAVQRAFDVYRGDKMNHQPVTFMRKGADRQWVRIDGFASAAELLREYQGLVSEQ